MTLPVFWDRLELPVSSGRMTAYRSTTMPKPARTSPESQAPIIGVSTCVLHDGRFLLIQRGKAPNLGLWSLPGGHVEYSETLRQAAARELREETTITADIGDVVDVLDIIRRDDANETVRHYVVVVFQGHYLSGNPRAGDDAADTAWVTLNDARALPRTDTLLDVLHRAQILFTRV